MWLCFQVANVNDGDSVTGSLENFDDRCDQWVNAPAPQVTLIVYIQSVYVHVSFPRVNILLMSQ